MSSAIRPDATTFSGIEPTVLPMGPVLVASDASAEAEASFPLAQVVAAHGHASVEVITVMQPFAMPMYGIEAVAIPLDTNTAAESARVRAIRDQMARLLPKDAKWPVTALTGEPVREIVEHARRSNARMLVVGRGRHGAVDRVLGGESVLRLLQLGDTPVLAVEHGMTTLPRRVVMATDFSAFSLYAAQVGMSMVAPDAIVHLVNVGPPFVAVDAALHTQAAAYREQATQGFAMLHERLERDDVVFKDILLEGNASDALLAYAKVADADLIVLATHGYGFLRRAVLGSVAAELVRRGACSLLIVPGSARTLATARAQSATAAQVRAFDAAMMDDELASFTKRNAGRACSIEIDALDFGAQMLGHELPLVGATFERAARSAIFMFGASSIDGQHLAHTIPGATNIELLTNGGGRDQALRIVHGSGQTIITLH